MHRTAQRVLITGGAGFIGSHLAQRLLEAGYTVRILDNLMPQVHGADAKVPSWLADASDVRIADVCDRQAVQSALEGVDAVVHLAAETGPAQSMYEIERYTQTNVQGTAILLQELLPIRDRVRKLVVASSRAIYGEGKYICVQCGVVYPEARPDERLQAGLWEPICPTCGNEVSAVATDEESLPKPTSIYAVTKLTQEHMCLVTGRAYDIPTIALRYQNVYGPGQSLRNPYVGSLAIFAARIKSANPILIYEDGAESRDFVHVDDAVQATMLALESPLEGAHVFNVGSGQPISIMEVATTLSQLMGKDNEIRVTGNYRVGDIRHCYADLTRVTSMLGYTPQVDLKAGLRDLAEWAWTEVSFSDDLDRATNELMKVGLYR